MGLVPPPPPPEWMGPEAREQYREYLVSALSQSKADFRFGLALIGIVLLLVVLVVLTS